MALCHLSTISSAAETYLITQSLHFRFCIVLAQDSGTWRLKNSDRAEEVDADSLTESAAILSSTGTQHHGKNDMLST